MRSQLAPDSSAECSGATFWTNPAELQTATSLITRLYAHQASCAGLICEREPISTIAEAGASKAGNAAKFFTGPEIAPGGMIRLLKWVS